MKSVYSAIAFLLVSGVLLAFATRQEYSQTIVKDFPIHSDGLVELDNSFGPVEVKTWTQNRVKINVTITVRASSEQKARDVFDQVNVHFTDTPQQVSVQTAFVEEKSWWNWESEEKKDFSIKYEVWLPNTVNLNIENKYGDVILAEMRGKTSISLKYGNLQIEQLHEDLHLNFSHGTGQIAQVKDVEGALSYCNIQIQESRDLKLETAFSNLQIQQAEKVYVNSKYNNFQLGKIGAFDYEGRYDVVDVEEVDKLQAIAKYSDFHVGTINDSGAFDLEYGLAKIDHLDRNFDELSLVGRFTDYKLEVEKGMAYKLQAAADYAGISYPESLQVTYEQESSTFHEVEGYGGNQQGGSVIKAQLNYGGLKVTD
ncbi:MAG: hypothetical protein GYB31_20385 [Bacteroidetes bacterium]|nr:hypothetical protein [Bacteroidota bacterium]